jgi:hypothetical protein
MALHLSGLDFSVPSLLKTLLYANGNTVKLSFGQARNFVPGKGKKY